MLQLNCIPYFPLINVTNKLLQYCNHYGHVNKTIVVVVTLKVPITLRCKGYEI